MILKFGDLSTEVSIGKIVSSKWRKSKEIDFKEYNKSSRVYKLICDYLNIEEKFSDENPINITNCNNSLVCTVFIKYFESLVNQDIPEICNKLVTQFYETDILGEDFPEMLTMSLGYYMIYCTQIEFEEIGNTSIDEMVKIYKKQISIENNQK